MRLLSLIRVFLFSFIRGQFIYHSMIIDSDPFMWPLDYKNPLGWLNMNGGTLSKLCRTLIMRNLRIQEDS